MARVNMTRHWQHKTRHSPFREKLIDSEEKRVAIFARMNDEMKEEQTKRRILENMTGKPSFEVCPKSRIPQFEDMETQIALEYRLQARDAVVIAKEKKFVDGMVERELSKVKAKFPKLNGKFPDSSSGGDFKWDSNAPAEIRETYDQVFAMTSEEDSQRSTSLDDDAEERERPLTSLKFSAKELDLELNYNFGSHHSDKR